MLRCGNVRVRVPAVNAANRTGAGRRRRTARLAGRSPEPAAGWTRARKSAIAGKSLAVDIRSVVARQKQRRRRDFFGLAGPLQRIELTDFVFLAGFADAVEERLGHAGFDQAGANGVDAHAGAEERGGG